MGAHSSNLIPLLSQKAQNYPNDTICGSRLSLPLSVFIKICNSIDNITIYFKKSIDKFIILCYFIYELNRGRRKCRYYLKPDENRIMVKKRIGRCKMSYAFFIQGYKMDSSVVTLEENSLFQENNKISQLVTATSPIVFPHCEQVSVSNRCKLSRGSVQLSLYSYPHLLQVCIVYPAAMQVGSTTVLM